MSEVESKNLEELRKNMKGVKRVILKITLDLKTGEIAVEHSPKKRYDPNVVLALSMTVARELMQKFILEGKLELPIKTKAYIA